MKKNNIIVFIVVCLALLLFYRYNNLQKSSQQKIENDLFILQEWTGETMGTTYSIKTYIPALFQSNLFTNLGVTLDSLSQAIKNRLKEINQKMSTYEPSSEISKLNDFPADKPFRSSQELLNLIVYANQFSKLSDGYYDITLGSLINRWGFGSSIDNSNSLDISMIHNNTNQNISTLFKNSLENDIVLPSKIEVQTLKKNIGYQFLTIDKKNNQIIKQLQDLHLDLSSIAKGYAVDELSKLLSKYHLTNHLVEIGGEIRVSGYKYKNIPKRKATKQINYSTPWQIGINHPGFNSKGLQKVISLGVFSTLNNAINSVATSGDYQNFIIKEDQKYSHILNAKTGFPISNKITSLTVFSTNCTTADALATMLIVMPFKDSLALAKKENLLVYYLYYEKKKLKEKITPRLKDHLKNLPRPLF